MFFNLDQIQLRIGGAEARGQDNKLKNKTDIPRVANLGIVVVDRNSDTTGLPTKNDNVNVQLNINCMSQICKVKSKCQKITAPADKVNEGKKDKKMIFIIGTPSCGTTLFIAIYLYRRYRDSKVVITTVKVHVYMNIFGIMFLSGGKRAVANDEKGGMESRNGVICFSLEPYLYTDLHIYVNKQIQLSFIMF